jgi:acyl dehydratase
MEEVVSPEQALLYRLSGDTNPRHADPEFAAKVGFEQGPILHGLATFGFLCRAVAKSACGGDADRIRSLTAQFKKPVWPGEKLRTEGFVVDTGIALQMFAGDRPEAVVSQAAAELV